ncbi:MAG: hypothetical protein Q8M09_05875 [Pseudomonadota bacterium]|nr:hypothetical protein [Pseudomonadota bacterium]MDP1903759.1 hypothetical protein [Pseudomonadota bacterium]
MSKKLTNAAIASFNFDAAYRAIQSHTAIGGWDAEAYQHGSEHVLWIQKPIDPANVDDIYLALTEQQFNDIDSATDGCKEGSDRLHVALKVIDGLGIKC